MKIKVVCPHCGQVNAIPYKAQYAKAACGACTLHVDGEAVRSCSYAVRYAAGKNIRTIEGLSSGEQLHPVQQAFIDQQVPQCSWCMSGQMMTASAFLDQNPSPSADEIEEAMSSNYCRCGCYARIRLAVADAAETIQANLDDEGSNA